MFLPPKVVGPLTELSAFVTVVGAMDGATVQLLANNAPVGLPTIASSLAINVGLGGAKLIAGQQVTATQSDGVTTSPPSPLPELVGAAPIPATGLPAVVFLSLLHTCVDWVLIGGLIPGVDVEVLWRGRRIGSGTASGPVLSVNVSFPQTPSPGDILEARQSFTPAAGPVIQGPTVASLPLAPGPPGEPPAPAVQQPFECDLAVLVSGLLDGVSLTLKHNADLLSGYPFIGSPVWATLARPVKGADTLAAKQEFRHCRRSGGFSAPVGVNPAPGLPLPVIVGPVCPNAPVLRVQNLRPGADVYIQAVKDPNTGILINQDLGHARAWAPDCDFPLPPGWADHPDLVNTPGKLSIQLTQSNCGKYSAVASHAVAPLPGAVGTPALQPIPMQCARLVSVINLTPGAVATLRSDQPDAPQLSPPIPVAAATLSIFTYRPLRPAEQVWVQQVGCGVDAESAHETVQDLADLPAPVLEAPVRLPRGGVFFRKLLPGGRLYVFVKGNVRAGLDISSDRMFVPLSGLQVEDPVWGIQSMCGKYSRESNHENVLLGVMKTKHTPSPITRGKPVSVAVTATDPESQQPVNGNVRVSGAIAAATGASFPLTVALHAAGPPAFVEASGYAAEPVTWNLVDPPPTPAASLHLAINNQAGTYFTITNVQWSCWRQELNGTFTLVASPAGQSVTVTPPANGQYHIHADVSVNDLTIGQNVLAEFRGNANVSGVATLVVVWTGVDLSHTFRLIAETQVLQTGSGTFTYINPVVVS